MKKLYEIGELAGLEKADVNRITRLGLLGLLAMAVASVAACFRPQKPEPAPDQSSSPQTLRDLANSVNNSTGTPQGQDNCGPYPGYPCGTRYYTVSASDARRLA